MEKDQNDKFIITDSNGQVILDAANFPPVGSANEYDPGDVLLIVAYDGQNHDAVKYTIIGDENSQTLTLNAVAHSGPSEITTTRIMSILAANTGGSVAFAKVYSVEDGTLLAHLEVPTNDTRDHSFGGGQGKGAAKGFVIEREATTLVVTVTER